MTGVVVLLLSILVLGMSGATWADASDPHPTCGGDWMSEGEVCDRNGVETTYDEAVQEQQNGRQNGPVGVAVSSAFLVASIVFLIACRRRGRKTTA